MSWHRISLVAVCLFAVGGTIALADSLPKNPSSQILAQHSGQHLGLDREKSKFLEELDLSAQQKQQLQEIRTKEREEMRQLRESLYQERQTLERMAIDTASADEVREQYQKVRNLQVQLGDLHFENMLGMREVLTPAQRQKLAELMEQRRQKFRGNQENRGFSPDRP
ncbi:MAG: Spy/CpxP family protein refolding chaperone [Spirulinaceae cyanobacterium]